MDKHNFTPETAFNTIKDHWLEWAEKVGAKNWVVGISGGKDSTVVTALAVRLFGENNVFGVLMPNGEQKDISDSEKVVDLLKIPSKEINIGNTVTMLTREIEEQLYHGMSNDATVNLPPRIRMATLYAVAQTLDHAFVLNTSNLSEDVLGYATLWGDTCGSYAPIQHLTVTEILALGDWLGLPNELVHKTPSDGLQGQSDEDRLGVRYADVDRLIRTNEATPEVREKVMNLYKRNKFKLDMIRLPGPQFSDLPNFVAENAIQHENNH